jgi:hypothetical protein
MDRTLAHIVREGRIMVQIPYESRVCCQWTRLGRAGEHPVCARHYGAITIERVDGSGRTG